MATEIQSYVYKVTNKITNQFYFGSRTKNVTLGRSPEDDIWKFYFTSSDRVKSLIEKYGKDSFEVEIVFRDNSYNFSFLEEQRLIVENIGNALMINKAWVDPSKGVVLTSFNETLEERLERGRLVSKAKKGKSNGREGSHHSQETIDKIKKQVGWKHTPETLKILTNAGIDRRISEKYHFMNKRTGQEIFATPYDFGKISGLDRHAVSSIVNKRKPSYHGWQVIEK